MKNRGKRKKEKEKHKSNKIMEKEIRTQKEQGNNKRDEEDKTRMIKYNKW